MPISKAAGKRDGKQQYRVRVNYTDANGKYRQVERRVYGLAEARLMEAKLQAEHTTGSAHSGCKTLADLAAEYLKAKRADVRESTYQNVEKHIRLYILPSLGTARLDKISTPALQEWKNTLNCSQLSLVSKQHIYASFRTLFNFAVKMGYLSNNPILIIGNFRDPYFKAAQDRLHYYTPEQFIKYIQVVKKEAEASGTLTDWGYYVFFMIAYYTGMRKGEINALTWEDIEGDVIHVRKSVTQNLHGADTITPPKNRSSYRDLQAPVPLLDALHEHHDRQSKAPGFRESMNVCGGERCLRDTSIDNRNRAFADAAGLPRIRIHDFRHSHASLLANSGINIQEVARRLGHTDIKMTWNTYSHLYPKEEERALTVLNAIHP